MGILNLNEAAKFLKMCPATLYKLITDHKIPATQLAGKWVFSEKQLIEHIEHSAKDNVKEKPVVTKTRKRRNPGLYG
jgi:excisionase family DNA binding protein